jgi:hypothetical protein
LKMTIGFHFTKLAGIWGPSSLKKLHESGKLGQILRENSSPLTPKILRKWIVVDPGCLYEESHQNLIKSLKKIADPNLGVSERLVSVFPTFSNMFQHCPNFLWAYQMFSFFLPWSIVDPQEKNDPPVSWSSPRSMIAPAN